jgi:hypothetical protein
VFAEQAFDDGPPEPWRPAVTIGGVSIARYRCTTCGNLTRFDVTTTRRTRAFHHYTVGGELRVEQEEVLSEQVEEVACRWCGNGRAVVALTEDEVHEVEAPGH